MDIFYFWLYARKGIISELNSTLIIYNIYNDFLTLILVRFPLTVDLYRGIWITLVWSIILDLWFSDKLNIMVKVILQVC